MAHNNIEIEIQAKVDNSKALLGFLQKHAKFEYENRQVDEYFTPPDRSFIAKRPTKEWLRLRDSNGKYSINYKNWHFEANGNSTHCDEFETKVEDIEQVNNILTALKFKSLTIVDKLRKVWTYKDYEIAMDSVKGLGDFVEVEYIGKKEVADPNKVMDDMIQFLKANGCRNIQSNQQGYPFLLLFPKEASFRKR